MGQQYSGGQYRNRAYSYKAHWQKGRGCRMNDILSTLRKDEYSNKCAIDLLLAVRAFLGEEGPCYFEPGIISHVSIKVSLQYPLAKRERKLLEDVISAFYKRYLWTKNWRSIVTPEEPPPMKVFICRVMGKF